MPVVAGLNVSNQEMREQEVQRETPLRESTRARRSNQEEVLGGERQAGTTSRESEVCLPPLCHQALGTAYTNKAN